MNYRSVVIYGNGCIETGPDKTEILDAIVERLIPGRTSEIRPATRKEINATTVVSYELREVSAKIRTGLPNDDAKIMSYRYGRVYCRSI